MEGFMFPASTIPVVSRPQGIGKVFFVSHSSGDNGNNGVDPNTPFESITYALTQVVANRGDYIIPLDTWQSEPSWPILLNGDHRRTHIIMFTFESSTPQGYMVPPGAGDFAVFEFESAAYMIEIAGFTLGGGASHGCIEIGSAQNNWIHHCWFGHKDQLEDTVPLYGVWVNVGPAHGLCVENCVFLGDQVDAGGGITSHGFCTTGGGNQPKWAIIRNNLFLGCDAGINMLRGNHCMILDNRFTCRGVQGMGITLEAACIGNMIDGNVAMNGDAVIAANPFVDHNGAAANHWGRNYATLAGGEGMEIRPA